MKISGFTIVRNAEILGYPFLESVRSALPFCSEFIVNCGDSTDSTRKWCSELEREYPNRIRVIDSLWSREAQSGGFQLKAQTDAALAKCSGDWCLYLQADEVLHESDFSTIKKDLALAQQYPSVDGIAFQYLHFYGSFQFTIEGRNWYRREVRLFKNHRGIHSFRDAQGFRRVDGSRLLALPTKARVFHYGYVRNTESFYKKSTEMTQWWGEKPPSDPQRYKLKRHLGIRKFGSNHPAVMQARMQATPMDYDPKRSRWALDADEIKNALTLLWEKCVPFRIGEFRNYDLYRSGT